MYNKKPKKRWTLACVLEVLAPEKKGGQGGLRGAKTDKGKASFQMKSRGGRDHAFWIQQEMEAEKANISQSVTLEWTGG